MPPEQKNYLRVLFSLRVLAFYLAFYRPTTKHTFACAVPGSVSDLRSEVIFHNEIVSYLIGSMDKGKWSNLERWVIWSSQAKSSVNHKLHPLFLVFTVSMKWEFGSSKDGWAT